MKDTKMTDLKERLRDYRPTNEWGDGVHHVICDEAADRIESLETQLAEARAVIEPFANADIDISGTAACGVTGDDILAARAFLNPASPSCPRCGHTTDSEIHAFGCKEITP